MAEFIYTTSTSVRGPWLIDADKLEELDNILGEEEARLLKRNEERLNAEVERQLQGDYVVDSKMHQLKLRKLLRDDSPPKEGEEPARNAEEPDREAEIEKIKGERRNEI